MKKTHGVFLGMLALGLAALGTPSGRAAGGPDANAAGSEAVASPTTSTTTSTSTSSAASAASPEDLDRRIEALETELVSLRNEMEARKEADATAAASAAASPSVSIAASPQDTAAPTKTTIATLLGPTSLSGFIDTYYQFNVNHPSHLLYPGADFRAFDYRDNSVSLNMIELILDKAPDATAGAAGRTGYHFSAGYGDAMTVLNASEGSQPLGFDQYVKEAYFSYLAPVGSGLQIDVGKFVTPMGAEVIESKDNWNYSRGLLFTYAIPLFHFGARAKYTFNPKYNITGFFVNGFNDVVDNNTGKTFGVSFVGNPTKTVTYTINYFAGPETPTGAFGFTSPAMTNVINVDNTWRQTWDATAMWTPNSKWSFMTNFDYGRGDRAIINGDDYFGGTNYNIPECATTPCHLSMPVYWTGIAGYVKYSPDANDYFAGRYEYYDDFNGFTTTTSVPGFTTDPESECQTAVYMPETVEFGEPYCHIPPSRINAAGGLKKPHYNEFTLTYQRTISSYLLARFEFRRDMSNYPVYAISTFGPGVTSQNTATIGLIFLFDTRNIK